MKKLTTLALAGGLTLIAVGCDVAGTQVAQSNQALTAQGTIPGQYLVKFRSGTSAAAHAAAHAAGGSVVRDLAKHDLFAARLPAAALNGLRQNPNIEYIEPDAARFPLAQTTPYGVTMVKSPEALGISGVIPGDRTVCIIDSGYSIDHEDLPSNVTGTTLDPGLDWDHDGCGHGTHVAGTIAAVDNDIGVVGVAPTVNLHIVRVFGDDCSWASSSSLIAALDACQTAGADVVSMSLGGSFKSRSEDQAFARAYGAGVLSVAAAGNDGNKRKSYPASYSSVISVAAIDENKVVASFSQQNAEVELAAPGVGVLSTVPMGTGIAATLATTDTPAVDFAVEGMEGSPFGTATAPLFDCGTAESTCTGATGQICLIQRGVISFADKVLNCQAGGGIGAVIYNDVSGTLLGTLGGVPTSIPSVGTSDTAGADLLSYVGTSTQFQLSLAASNYAAWDGTSMATPHVSAAAALVWSKDTSCGPDQVRTALDTTAEDLGAAGRDEAYGYGLVNAFAATDALDCSSGGGGGGGGTTTPECTIDSDCGPGYACDNGTCVASCNDPSNLGPGCLCSSDSACVDGKCKGKPGSQTCN